MPLIPFLGSHAIFFLVTPYFHYNPHPGFVQMVRYLPSHGLLNISTTILHLHMLITHFVLAELPFLHLLDGLMITSKCLGVGAPMPFTSIFEKKPILLQALLYSSPFHIPDQLWLFLFLLHLQPTPSILPTETIQLLWCGLCLLYLKYQFFYWHPPKRVPTCQLHLCVHTLRHRPIIHM